MNRREAIEEIRSRVPCERFLHKAQRGGYICPFCGSGTHAHKTGALKLYTGSNKVYCHKCEKSADVIDLFQQESGQDFIESVATLAFQLGIEIDGSETPGRAQTAGKGHSSASAAMVDETTHKGAEPATGPRAAAQTILEPGTASEPAPDYSAYYGECNRRLQLDNSEATAEARAYLQRRGISPQTAVSYGVGFDGAADPATAPGILEGDADGQRAKKHPCPRLIFPTNAAHYTTRRIDGGAAYEKLDNKGSSARTKGLFNQAALYGSAVKVLVCEGVFDALSALEAGAQAIALNSATQADRLIETLRERPTRAELLLSLDPDTAGDIGADKLRAGLESLGIAYRDADIAGGHKDPNAFLTADRRGFFEAIKAATAEPITAEGRPIRAEAQPITGDAAEWSDREPSSPAEPAEAQTVTEHTTDGRGAAEGHTGPDSSTSAYLDRFLDAEIKSTGKPTPTGFDNLDRLSGGGLFPGLYLLTSIPSLGKTSFVLQLCDQIAEGGRDVIFYSLEQSTLELTTKSLARYAAAQSADAAGSPAGPSALEIRTGAAEGAKEAAIRAYKRSIGDRVTIIEAGFSYDVEQIKEHTRAYIKAHHGARPVLCVDYLQVLQPPRGTHDRREAIDANITELKRLSQAEKVAIVLVSSMNRNNYLLPADIESIKETGHAEYTADVIWGLQPSIMTDDRDGIFTGDPRRNTAERREAINKAKAETPRRLDLICLKNRFGTATYKARFYYYPANDLFRAAAGEGIDANSGGRKGSRAPRPQPAGGYDIVT